MDRIFEKLEWRGDCLVWTGCTDPKGYGRVHVDGSGRLVHRIVWLEQRPDPGTPLLRHSCDNPPCANLDHLLPGTAKNNSDDMYERGREQPAWRGVTHCPRRGHEFTDANTYVTPDGRRQCRACRAEAQRRYLAK